jgi:phosphoglycerate kinase
LGGAKISDAFLMMDTVLSGGIADTVLTGGLVGEVLLWADGEEIGEPSRAFIIKEGYGDLVETAKKLLAKYRDKIMMPQGFAAVIGDKRIEYPLGQIPSDVMTLDISAAAAEKYQKVIRSAKTVFVNGPMGVFERELSEAGTKMVWDALGDTPAYTVIGGGDSITATKKYGKTKDIDYICTGGGALIRFLTGEELPVVKALRQGSNIQRKIQK